MHFQKKVVRQMICSSNKRAEKGRLKRLEFLLSKECHGRFQIDALAYEYYEETRLCWYVGAFVATIIMSQLAFEEALRSFYRAARGVNGNLNRHKKINEAGFADLIEQSRNDSIVSRKEANALNRLRRERNPYVHTRDIGVGRASKQPNFFKSYIKIKAPQLVESGVEDEAKKAIRTLMEVLPKIAMRIYGHTNT